MLHLCLTMLVLGHIALADLPDGCTPLNEYAFSSVDPATIFGANTELQGVAPPYRIGDWRDEYSIPTHHFATNQIKGTGMFPVRTMPYSATLSNEGVTYDAYTLDRWNVTSRSDNMQQQTPRKVGEPWERVTSLGTNMKQMVSGPDGNPLGQFTGRSGIQVGILGSGDPKLSAFGDMYGDFTYTDSDGGKMEALLVRGSALLTHRFSNADPVLTPYCLSSVNGRAASFSCPMERSDVDAGEGYLFGSCSGGSLTLTLRTTKAIDIGTVQYATNTIEDWPTSHSMNTCGDECVIDSNGRRVVITVPGNSIGEMAFAMNVVGRYSLPNDWINNPMRTTCEASPSQEVDQNATAEVKQDDKSFGPTLNDRKTAEFCSSLPELSPCPAPFCKLAFCQALDIERQNFKLIVQLREPISSITQVQFAVNTGDNWDTSHPMIRCTPEVCTLQSDGLTLTYCGPVPAGVIKYAVNVEGKFIQPPSNWETSPFQFQCGGAGVEIDTGKKFVLELNEPGDKLPDQTRKYVVYFSHEMNAISDANGLNFKPVAGGKFTGLMQLAYAGANKRGDMSRTTFFDQYAGVYSYHPKTSYCAEGDKGYVNFDWNKHDVTGPTESGNLLMITMPHHEILLESQGDLVETPFTFRGFVGDFWLLEEDLPASTLDADPAGVERVKNDPRKLQVMLEAIDNDARQQNLTGKCGVGNSYWVGKDILMVARVASLSRSFGTDHYKQLDQQIRACLDKWLRIDDTLVDDNKFRYDSVWGGLLLRGGPKDEPLDTRANFGFSVYSDHHYHVGYHIYAAAYYARYDPSWATDNKERILTMARDVGNPSFKDKYFPIARHKDFYVGMSWATGIVGTARQEESSSEGIMCYHALAALGLALGDENMEGFGQLMMATEIRSVREYFHVRAHNKYLFPPQIQQNGVIGQFAEDGIFYYTLNWGCEPPEFPMRHACLVGIQVLPIMSVSKYFMDQEWAGAVRDICDWAIKPTSAPGAKIVDPKLLQPVDLGWGAFCRAATASYDSARQDEAEEYVRALSLGDMVTGSSVSGTLMFIYEST